METGLQHALDIRERGTHKGTTPEQAAARITSKNEYPRKSTKTPLNVGNILRYTLIGNSWATGEKHEIPKSNGDSKWNLKQTSSNSIRTIGKELCKTMAHNGRNHGFGDGA